MARTLVMIVGEALSSLAVIAMSAMSITATTTATAQGAEGNPSAASGTVTMTVKAPPLDHALHRVSASAGMPQLPDLFNRYAVRPPWQVAGVDYYVGVSKDTQLKDPTLQADLPAGATVDARHRLIRVDGNNVTLDGFDFSLHGGYSVYVDNASGTRIINSYFLGGVPVTIMENHLIPVLALTLSMAVELREISPTENFLA